MMGKLLMPCIYRAFRAAQYTKLARSPGTLRVLSKFPKLDLSVFECGRNGSRVLLRGTDIDPTESHLQFLMRGSDLVGRLLRETSAKLKRLPDGVLLEVGEVKLKLQNWEELFIATEVFAEGIYNLQTKGDLVLIDVGMNVGTTSLYFAAREICRSVYAFEPFPKTLEKAKVNLGLNPRLADKIHVHSTGLAAGDMTMDLDYVEEYKGSVGMYGMPDYLSLDEKTTRREKVRVNFVAAAEAISGIAARHPGSQLVCKMDCEGAEYEIIESLVSSCVASKIDYFMIEWHRKGSAAIERALVNAGFCLFSLAPNAPSFSMIYGLRRTLRAGPPTGTT